MTIPTLPTDKPVSSLPDADATPLSRPNRGSLGTSEERSHWIQKNHSYYDDIVQLCEFIVPQDATVLDVGCGTGDLIGRLKRNKKVGIDLSDDYIAYCRSHYPDTQFFVTDAENTDSLQSTFKDQTFDMVLLSDSLSYVTDVQTVLENTAQYLARHGRILVTAYNNLWEPLFRVGGFLGLRSPSQPLNWLDDADLKNLFELAGLEVVSKGSRLLLPKYIPLLSSWVNRYIARIWPFRIFSVYHYYVLRAKPVRMPVKRVSVVVPARNEAGTLERLLESIPQMAPEVEVLFVEGHSKDNTWDVMKALPKHPRPGITVEIMKQEGEGKADAVHKGFRAATGDVLMILDADLSVQTVELDRFCRAIVEGRGEFINGSRLVYRLENDAMQLLNLFGNKLFGKIFSYLLGQTFKDTLCGTKVLWRKDWERIMEQRSYFGDFDPFGDFELLFGASKLNLKIISLPVHYKARVYGETNIRRFRHALLLFRMCWIAARRLKFA